MLTLLLVLLYIEVCWILLNKVILNEFSLACSMGAIGYTKDDIQHGATVALTLNWPALLPNLWSGADKARILG